VKYAVVHNNIGAFSVQLMCRMLEVSRAGYYAWSGRKESRRDAADRELSVKIAEVHERTRGIYGSPRVYAELHKLGEKCSRKRILRLMRSNGLVGKKRHTSKRSTMTPTSSFAASPNLVERRFIPAGFVLNQVWAGDITEIPTGDGSLYLAVVLDLRSREIVGWSMHTTRDTQIVVNALRMAINSRAPRPGLIFHSDQGVQYASIMYRTFLAEHGITQSMSRRGNCWDNAPVESFFATMKVEVDGLKRSPSQSSARSAVFEYLATFYNRQRRHSALAYQFPASVGRDSQAA
jgi:putative transposase